MLYARRGVGAEEVPRVVEADVFEEGAVRIRAVRQERGAGRAGSSSWSPSGVARGSIESCRDAPALRRLLSGLRSRISTWVAQCPTSPPLPRAPLPPKLQRRPAPEGPHPILSVRHPSTLSRDRERAPSYRKNRACEGRRAWRNPPRSGYELARCSTQSTRAILSADEKFQVQPNTRHFRG